MKMDKYKDAWFELLEKISGAIDGVEFGAERGSSQANKDVKIWREIEGMVNDVSEEHEIEDVDDVFFHNH